LRSSSRNAKNQGLSSALRRPSRPPVSYKAIFVFTLKIFGFISSAALGAITVWLAFDAWADGHCTRLLAEWTSRKDFFEHCSEVSSRRLVRTFRILITRRTVIGKKTDVLVQLRMACRLRLFAESRTHRKEEYHQNAVKLAAIKAAAMASDISDPITAGTLPPTLLKSIGWDRCNS